MNSGAEGIDGPRAIHREDSAAGATSALISAAEARDHCISAARRTRWDCRPEIVSRERSHPFSQPPAGRVVQASGQEHDGGPLAAKATGKSAGALSSMQPDSRHSHQLANQGAPSDKTATATVRRRKFTRGLRDEQAIMGGQIIS